MLLVNPSVLDRGRLIPAARKWPRRPRGPVLMHCWSGLQKSRHEKSAALLAVGRAESYVPGRIRRETALRTAVRADGVDAERLRIVLASITAESTRGDLGRAERIALVAVVVVLGMNWTVTTVMRAVSLWSSSSLSRASRPALSSRGASLAPRTPSPGMARIVDAKHDRSGALELVSAYWPCLLYTLGGVFLAISEAPNLCLQPCDASTTGNQEDPEVLETRTARAET